MIGLQILHKRNAGEREKRCYIRHRLSNDYQGWGITSDDKQTVKRTAHWIDFLSCYSWSKSCHAENKENGITPWEGILKREARLSDPSPIHWDRHVMSNKVKIQNETNVSCPLPTSFPIQVANDSHMSNTPFQVSTLGRHIVKSLHLVMKPMCFPLFFLTSDDYRMAQ